MAKAVCSLLLLPLSGTGGLRHIYCDCMGTCSTFSGAGSRDECYRGAEIRPDLGLLAYGDVGSRLRNSEHTLCRCLGGSNAAPFINTVGGAGGYRARGSRLPASCLSRMMINVLYALPRPRWVRDRVCRPPQRSNKHGWAFGGSGA